MNTHPVQALDPVFDYLDSLIRDYGDILFMLFTHAAIPFLVWVLCGRLRRKLLRGEQLPHVPPVIVIHIPIGRPTPPPEPFNLFSPLCEPPDGDPDDG
jgi:hypothetical protein